MEQSIRTALIACRTIPAQEMTPEDWTSLIYRICDNLDPLAEHMYYEYTAAKRLAICNLFFESDLTVACGSPSPTYRFNALVQMAAPDYSHVVLTYGQDAELRVELFSLADADSGAYQYSLCTHTSAYIAELLAGSPLDSQGRNTWALEAVASLLKLVRGSADRKQAQAQSFRIQVDAATSLANLVCAT